MNILVVDQSELFARLTRALLEKWGHTVTLAANGDEALALLERDPYRIVILDFELQGYGGLDLCRKIRQLNNVKYTYIIFFTQSACKESMLASLDAGADEYITKPLNMSELKLRIRKGRRLLSLEERAEALPGTDFRTGSLNEKAFRKLLRFAVADAKRAGKPGALLFIDLLNYRDIREAHGFYAASRMIIEINRLIADNIRESDLLGCRNDGTLCVLLQNTDAEHCGPLLQKLSLLMQNLHITVDDAEFKPAFRFRPLDYLTIADTQESVFDAAAEMTEAV